ncbi:MAG TPA: FAD-dependent oxidoreductase, partial [Chloroflexota bacterium]|jgi:monoamine oxidase|nr:FAD-dependent oxidoreductase [Chloroflexota bacterium]
MAAKLIVTLPLPVLQQGHVVFAPGLPDTDRALNGLRMGAVIKVALWFDEPFWWTPQRQELGFLSTSGQPFPVLWTTYPVIAPLLLAWLAGPAAAALSNLDDDELVERALRTVDKVFKVRSGARLRHRALHNWQRDPLAGGAYSYVAVGGEGSQRALAQPVANTIFFAGEATDWTGHHATVHGALATGYRAAREALGEEVRH